MLAPHACFQPAVHYRRNALAIAVAVILSICYIIFAVVSPETEWPSELSSERFFAQVNPKLARLMSTKENPEQIDDPSLYLPPSMGSGSSSSFYSDVSSSLGRLMHSSDVLAEDAAELRIDDAAAISAPLHLPYDEAAALGASMSSSAFQRVVASVNQLHQHTEADYICHACVRAAAAAARAKAKTAAAAARAKADIDAAAAKAKAQNAAQARAANSAERLVKALRRRQKADVAAAAFNIAKRKALITRLQKDPSFPKAALQPMQDALHREQARAKMQRQRDAAAIASASRHLQQ